MMEEFEVVALTVVETRYVVTAPDPERAESLVYAYSAHHGPGYQSTVWDLAPGESLVRVSASRMRPVTAYALDGPALPSKVYQSEEEVQLYFGELRLGTD